MVEEDKSNIQIDSSEVMEGEEEKRVIDKYGYLPTSVWSFKNDKSLDYLVQDFRREDIEYRSKTGGVFEGKGIRFSYFNPVLASPTLIYIMRKLIRIKIKKEDGVKGFYGLLITDKSIICLPNNEYIIPKEILKNLKKKKINFTIVN